MNLDWSAEQSVFLEQGEAFARDHLTGNFAERDRASTFHQEGWDRLVHDGLLQQIAEGPIVNTFLLLQGFGRGTPDVGFLLSLNAHIWGTMLPHPVTAPHEIGTHAITEPGAGSDLRAMKSVAMCKDDSYHLIGTKTYITNAPIADVFVVYVKQDTEARDATLSVFLLRKDDPGVTLTKTFTKMGLRTAPMGEIQFDTTLPKDRLLGEEGAGFARFHTALELERAGIFASILGVMESQLQRTIQRAKERVTYEKPIAAHASVANRIIDMKMRVATGELLLKSFLNNKIKGRRAPMESAMVKLFLSESFVASSIDAVQIHGALGYVEEGGIEHYVRDAIGGLLLSGTSDIQRNTIAKLLGLPT